jgi:16S rRNA (guanine527-N7)-methyltransferase
VEPQREPLPTRVQDTPTLPASYDDALVRGLVGLGLADDLQRHPAVRTAIDGHVRLLLAWTPHINLTAIREPSAVATAHVLDSLSALPWLRGRGTERVLDLGSGGGYPGLPLAAAMPGSAFSLVEPVAKKAGFLRAVVEATGLTDRVTVLTARAEALAADPGQRGTWSVVTARAVASMAELVELSFPLLAHGGSLVAWKRGDLSLELEDARRAVDALGGGTLEVHDITVPGLTDHRLAIATRTGVAPAAYPRDPAARRRRPW